jgi:hypothetical protein
MATKKNNTYVGMELDWLEAKAVELKEFVDAKPFADYVDRMVWKETKTGGSMPMIAATIEAQLGFVLKALKEYALIIDVINGLREKNDISSIRGGGELPPMMVD